MDKLPNLNEDFNAIIESVPIFNPLRQYWLMRTMSGLYYNDFVQNNFISIGYDKITLLDIKASSIEFDPVGDLSNKIKQKYPGEKRFGTAANQLLNFAYEMKKGDIIVIPSAGSSRFAIGTLLSNAVILNDEFVNSKDPYICPFLKRREVKWFRDNLILERIDPKLIYLRYIHQALTLIDNSVSEGIDRIISPIYIRNNRASLVVDVRTENNINGYEFFSSWIDLFNLAEQFGEINGLDINAREFDVKVVVESPGFVEISAAIQGVIAVAILIGAFAGIDLNYEKEGYKVNLKMKGLLKAISDFRDAQQNTKIKKELLEKLKKMDISDEKFMELFDKLEGNDENKLDKN